MSSLNLVCGPSGIGKSTWLHKYHNEDHIVSRDEIRFSMLNDEDDYFAHEDEVYLTFVQKINYYGAVGDKPVWVDQTNLSPGSRAKLLNAIQLSFFDEVNAYYVPKDRTMVMLSLLRNNNREGRAYVPEDVIKNMWRRYSIPTVDEGFNNIYQIEVVAL